MSIFERESKGISASGQFSSGNKFMILKGSFAVDDSQIQPSFYEVPSRSKIRQKLISDGKLQKTGSMYRFTENVTFNSPSEAASIVWGSHLNGKDAFEINQKPLSSHTVHLGIDSQQAIEGYRKDTILHRRQRDQKLIASRKKKDNYTCQICGFKLKIGKNYIIECHHLDPISLGERETKMDDLISLCPTCHRIIHTRHPIYSIEEVKNLVRDKHK